jgi:hypothetical protein
MTPRHKIAFLGALLLAVVLAGWLPARRHEALPKFRLPDGSELALVKVTQGKKHEVRYGNRWQDYLSPVLPAAVQGRLGSKVASLTPANSNAIVLWLWRREIPFTKTPVDYFLTVVDTNGCESAILYNSSCSYSTSPDSDLRGWELKNYPRRGAGMGIRIYVKKTESQFVRVAGFNIPDRSPMKTPVWPPESLPVTKRTNELEITLLSLETGLTAERAGLSSKIAGAKSFSQAVFSVVEDGKPALNWALAGLKAGAPSGDEIEPGNSRISAGPGRQEFSFTGPLWLDEPAWKLKVELARSADYPAEELWIIKGVPVPKFGGVTEVNAKTNIYGAEIEFAGLSGSNARLPPDWVGTRLHATIHARSPLPMSDTHLKLVEVRDDQKRKITQLEMSSTSSYAGRGATLRETDYGFGVDLPADAKTLDITFAFTRSRFVEFLAKPVLAKP